MNERLVGDRDKAESAMAHFCPWLKNHFEPDPGYSELGFHAMLRIAAVQAFEIGDVSSDHAANLREALSLSNQNAVFPKMRKVDE